MFENMNWNTETILILGIVTFVAFALLGLVIWNAKTNKQVEALISIDGSLKHLDALEPVGPASDPKTLEQTPDTIPGQTAEPKQVSEEVQEEVPEETIEPQIQTSVGRSGRVYTKEELEAQIR
jgi:hypothetical protein